MSKPRVILTRKWPEGAEARAKELFDVVINEDDHKMTVEELKRAMCDADALSTIVSTIAPLTTPPEELGPITIQAEPLYAFN